YTGETLPDDEAERILLESIQEGLAEHFLLQHRKNVMRGMRYNAENCLYNGHKMLGYTGRPDMPYEINVETSPIVKKIFTEYADGVPMKQIADELNNAGIRTVKNKEFTINSLRHILQNRAYIGEYKFGEYVIEGGMPRIIEDELFEKVKEKMAVNKHGGNRKALKLHPQTVENHTDFWLTDHVVCGCCGGFVHGSSGTSEKGKVHYYYVCNNSVKKKDKCKLKYIPQGNLETLVSHFLEEFMRDSTVRIEIAFRCYEYYKANRRDNSEYIMAIEKNIKEVDKKLANIMAAVEEGIYNKTTASRMKELETQKSLLEDELILEQNIKENELTLHQISKYLDRIVDLNDLSNKRRLLDALVSKIYLFENKVVINCYYLENQREIGFDDFKKRIYNDEVINRAMNEPHEIWYSEETLKSLIGEDNDFFQ
nr:recombinase family protein [Lachnospiraceae bacterium]